MDIIEATDFLNQQSGLQLLVFMFWQRLALLVRSRIQAADDGGIKLQLPNNDIFTESLYNIHVYYMYLLINYDYSYTYKAVK